MSSLGLRVIACAVLLTGCYEGIPDPGQSGTGGADSADGTSGTDGADGTSGTGAPPAPGGDIELGDVCEKPCEYDSDCCPATVPPRVACPSNAFPLHAECVQEMCVPDVCATNADCPFPLMQACSSVAGRALCVYLCGDDDDCTVEFNMPGTSCIGVTDAAGDFCSEYAENAP
ncbi:MAG: hypothetical protein JKY37_17270 [Nannocystaceae bacterium]|nr:hypothetical protein [Nannocystaceae bacterium]